MPEPLPAPASVAALNRWAANPRLEDLASASSAILLLSAQGELETAPPADREAWGMTLQGLQPPGSEVFARAPGEIPPPSASYHSQLALQALDALNMPPRHWPEAALRADPVDWLAALDWSQPQAASALAALRLQWLILAAETQSARFTSQPASNADWGDLCYSVRAALAWLDQAQDFATGLWGSQQGAATDDALLAVPGLLVFFDYLRWPLRHGRQRLEVTLERLAQDQQRGSETAALAWLLTASYHQFNHRRDEAATALARLAVGQQTQPELIGSASPLELADFEPLWWSGLTRALAATATGEPQPDAWRFARRPGPGSLPLPSLTPHERQALPRWISLAQPTPTEGTPLHALNAKLDSTRPAPPAITVVIPVFNLGRYLPEAVESVLAQTFQDYELIVVDDGSTDEYTSLLFDQWPYPRVSLLRQPNQGVAAARNHAIAAGAGRYVCCLDADDRLRPAYFERAVGLLDADAQVGLVTGAMQLFDGNDRRLEFPACRLPEMLIENHAMEPAMFRHAAWEQAGGYYAGFPVSGIEDWDLWIGILERGYTAAMLPEVVMDYRILPGSMSSRMFAPEIWSSLIEVLTTRHLASYQRLLPAALGFAARRKIELTTWAENREQARAWWERQARTWERTAQQQQARIAELQGWIASLDEAKQWLDEQRLAWQSLAEAHARRIAELEAELAARK